MSAIADSSVWFAPQALHQTRVRSEPNSVNYVGLAYHEVPLPLLFETRLPGTEPVQSTSHALSAQA